MQAPTLPADFVERFSKPGSTAQIANFGNPMVPPDEQVILEGAIERVWIEDTTLHIRFAWLASKDVNAGTWNLVEDETQLDFSHSLELFARAFSPDDGRFHFEPMEPIVHEKLLFIAADYEGPTGRTPLKREEVQPAA